MKLFYEVDADYTLMMLFDPTSVADSFLFAKSLFVWHFNQRFLHGTCCYG